jgi:hypothetical protein
MSRLAPVAAMTRLAPVAAMTRLAPVAAMTRLVPLLGATLALAPAAAGCGPQLDVGSDVLWSARFEDGTFSEWTGAPGGAVDANPTPPSMIEVSADHARLSRYAAKLTIDAGSDGTQENTAMSLKGNLPTEAYYSAWYYLPHSATVGTFWVISKFRMRTVADDATTEQELYDLDLVNLPTGEMSLQLFDHRMGGFIVPLDATGVVVPVGVWFQIEAFYRNAPDATGRVTYWLDGQEVVDVANHPMAPTPWVEWSAVSIGVNLTPSLEVLFIDDCAVSLTRVGPSGLIAR